MEEVTQVQEIKRRKEGGREGGRERERANYGFLEDRKEVGKINKTHTLM